MFDFEAQHINNPMFKLIVYLNTYAPDKIENHDFQFYMKNLPTHFKKLFYSVVNIDKLQKDSDFIQEYNKTGVIGSNLIEYCYFKISTVWDISYQIADILVFKNKKEKNINKYDYLEKRFKKYDGEFDNLHLKWYREINKIRNKITHGGITINPFFINSSDVGSRFCFQAYTLNLDDIVTPNYMYTNIYNNNINFADYYFTLQINLLYSYLTDFFDFILLEMNEKHNHDLSNLFEGYSSLDIFENSYKYWLLSDINLFKSITNDLIALSLCEGYMNRLKTIPDEIIKKHSSENPFKMLNNSSPAFEICENK
ncbi:hypothetical protein [Dickeya zeae]|uniref:hypothetical protein n=1 Tax=Dickeya zeae TaxID=204042 RepID=UPI001F209A6E|nr:hypothetical protein [Dickeya zeae]UJR62828.1 hypothetical protein HJ586_11815 [Dickeya zeae]